MCDKCQGFSERIRIATSREYLDLLRQLEGLITAATFWLVEGVPLAEVMVDGKWVDDVILHTFECLNCGQRFKLAMDTYHGSGGTWQTIDATSRRDTGIQ